MLTQKNTEKLLILLSFHGIFSEPHCSKFHYEEKLLEKMIRIEFMVENMKKEIETIRDQATTTLGNLESERETWENTLMNMKETGEQDLNNAIQKTKTDVQNELNKLADTKGAFIHEIKESLKRPEVVFSARNSKYTALTEGQTMVFTEIILNKGDAYNKDDGVFTVPYTGIYMFTVQLCLYSDKGLNFDFVANEVPFKMSYTAKHHSGACGSFDAMSAVKKNDSVKIKIRSTSSGHILFDRAQSYWNTFSGVLIQPSNDVGK